MEGKAPTLKKQRLDVLLVTRGIVETRNRVQQLIRGGHVRVEGKICTKGGTLVQEEIPIEVDTNAIPYVSRGGIKLVYALKVFNINVTDRVCLDIGASTGGFTDCLLKNGAKFVYAVDVGHGQLHYSLRSNHRVSYVEGVDIRNFSLPKDKALDLICIDVSFISVTLVLPVVKRFLSPRGRVIVLIKPQFEVGPGIVNRRGVVKKKKLIYEALNRILMLAQELKLFPVAIVPSPIQGKRGNIEYLTHLKLEAPRKIYNPAYLISELKRKEANKDEKDEEDEEARD